MSFMFRKTVAGDANTVVGVRTGVVKSFNPNKAATTGLTGFHTLRLETNEPQVVLCESNEFIHQLLLLMLESKQLTGAMVWSLW